MTGSEALLRHALLSDLLRQARSGSAEALGQLFEVCRGYLLTVARQELAAPLRAKFDAADMVQETFIEATRDFIAFHGDTAPQLLGWLRGILRHNLADVNRRFAACCRCLSQEEPLLDSRLAEARTRAYLAIGEPICDQLITQEQRRALDAALQRLPQPYRRVLQLRYGERCTLTEIANGFERSPEAVRKMVGRAVERLRQEMDIYAEA